MRAMVWWIGLSGLFGPQAELAAQQGGVLAVDGLRAEAWRERNEAARALIGAERIDEREQLAILDGSSERSGQEGVGSEVGIGLGGGAGGRFRDPLREALGPPEFDRPFSLIPSDAHLVRVLARDADLCVPWSSRVLALHVAAHRHVFAAQFLDAAAACVQTGEWTLAANAAAYLVTSGAAGHERRKALFGQRPGDHRMAHAVVDRLVEDPAIRREAIDLIRANDLPAIRILLERMWSLSDSAWKLLPDLQEAVLDHALSMGGSAGRAETSVRHAVALLASIRPPPVELLRDHLVSSDRRIAIAIIHKLGPRAQGLAADLSAFLVQPPVDRADDAVIWAELALGRMRLRGEAAREAVAALVARTSGRMSRRERLAIATALAGLGEGTSAQSKQWLCATAQRTSFRILEARIALETLQALGLGAEIPLDGVEQLAGHGDRGVAQAAATLLPAHGEPGIAALKAILTRRDWLIGDQLAAAVAANSPELLAEWCTDPRPGPRLVALRQFARQPQTCPLPLETIAALRADPDKAVGRHAWSIWLARAPADELITLLRDGPAGGEQGSIAGELIERMKERDLPAAADAALLASWLTDSDLATRAQNRFRQLDPELLRRSLAERLREPELADRARAELIEGLLESAPLTPAELELVERCLMPILRSEGTASIGLLYRLIRLDHHRAWVRQIGEDLLGQPVEQLRARGADLVWHHRDA